MEPGAAATATGRLANDQDSPAAQGRVISTDGTPIPGARVSWIGLEAQDIETNPSWDMALWEAAGRKTVETFSGADGSFAFAEPPSVTLAFGSALVAIRAGYFPAGIDLAAGRAQWPTIALELEPAPLISVEVVDSGGQPVPSARVVHTASPLHSWERGVHERFLRQEALTDPAGKVQLARFRGDQVLRAEQGERLSRPWRGADPERVVLVLGESFTLGGRITYPDRSEWSPDYVGERRIVVSGLAGALWRPLACLRGVDEGDWGPLRVPLGEFERYSARLEGAPITPQAESFAPPRAGGHSRIDFTASKGAELYLVVEDESHTLLTNAKAIAWWNSLIDPGETYVEGASRPDGFLYLGTFPPGEIYYRVWAPGFGAYQAAVTAPAEEALLITLAKGATVRGRCTHEGKPVEDFRVTYWRMVNPPIPRSQTFLDRVDGRFELANLTPGDWSVQASSSVHPAGKPVLVSLSAEPTREIEIELPAALRGVGNVLDAQTGTPVPNAWVQPYVSSGISRGPAWGLPVPIETDGSFDLDAFVVGLNHLTIGAEGFATAMRTATVASSELVDWGEIRLLRPQTLSVSLAGLEGATIRPSELVACTMEGHLLPEQRFSDDGRVVFEGVPPGDMKLLVFYPDSSFIRAHLKLDPGADWHAELAIGGPRRLDVHVLGPDGKPSSEASHVTVSAQEESGVYVIRAFLLDELGNARFTGIRAEQVQVDVRNVDNEALATREVALDEAADSRLEIRLGGSELRIQVVDARAQPVPGAFVTLRSSSGEKVLCVDDTDAEGWAALVGTFEAAALLDVKHASGRRFGVPVDASVQELQVVLDATGALELEFRDGDEVLAGVATRLETTGGVTLSDIQQSDARGQARFEALGEGNYRIGCSRADCWPATADRSLGRGERARVLVPMRRLADFVLTVLDRQGLPVAECPLELSSEEFGSSLGEWLRDGRASGPQQLVTERTGRLRILGVPRGQYSWSVSVEGQPITGSFELAPGSANEVLVRLP